ncbi:AMP-binding protein [Ancylobacter polymorphus]|uniref:AMP-binding protein n=1 Tax=Ancylobacter polymorphus TaxID=223390 RepID=A0A9E7A0E7_9HYPH|nr:AMP-binding protein [Ancylobacter polymorphus]UOK73322.1 AMP-binding protein [Ancylobacter polymorphus]
MKFDTTLTPERIAKYTAAGGWNDRSLLACFEHHVAHTPDQVAVVSPDGARLTYAELGKSVETIASNLHAAGLGQGDVLSVQLPNCAELVLLHLAALRLGAVTNPLLPNYRTKELSYILNQAGTKICVIPSVYRRFDYAAMYAELRTSLPGVAEIFVRGAHDYAGLGSWETLLTEPATPAPRPSADCNEVSLLAFTSGTESNPKGVMHSENTMMYGTQAMARLLDLTSQDVIWTPSPMGHGTAFQWGMRLSITIGGRLVLQDLWDPAEALRLIAREKCTFTLGATPFASMLLECPEIGEHDLSSFRIFGCAGAPIPEQLGARFREQTGCTLIGMWGMTECFVGSASREDDQPEKLWLTDGAAMPGAELAIFDETRTRTLAPGEVGELATRGPHVALGYFQDPERTQATFRADGWLFSNDLATIDEKGYIRLVGRMKEIINRGGLKISVREMEELLLSHGSFSAVAIVPVPDPRMVEKGCAFIVRRPGATASFREVTDYLESRGIAKYKLPEYFIPLDELPMTASGKIQKAQLKADFIAGKFSSLDEVGAA